MSRQGKGRAASGKVGCEPSQTAFHIWCGLSKGRSAQRGLPWLGTHQEYDRIDVTKIKYNG